MTEPTRHLPWLLWTACLVLLPFGRSAELAMLVAAVLGIAMAIREPARLRDPALRLPLLLFLGYWLPELLSAFDALAPRKVWTEVAADLRYLPMLAYFTWRLREPGQWRWALTVTGAVITLWALDASVQILTGWSLGGAVSADRLSGIFGAEDLKLGAALAVLSPFALVASWERSPRLAIAVGLLIGAIVLMAGTRAAWLMYALVCAGLLWRRLGARRTLLAGAAGLLLSLLLATAAYRLYPPFADRIERSAAVLQGDREGLDFALAFRLPIWETAGRMIAAHPFNGVGVRGFREAYVQYAGPDDPWIGFSGEGKGAAHPHQWLLEVLTDTGGGGLLIWLAAIALALRTWRHACPGQRAQAEPAALALLALLFPLNTHYAVYSSAWGGLLLTLLAGYCAALTAARKPSVQ